MILKIPRFRSPKSAGAEPFPKPYRIWLMLLLAILVFSLLVLVVTTSLAFIYYADVLTPLWLTVLGTLAAFGVALGFGGLFFLLVIAGYRSFKEDAPSKVLGVEPVEKLPQDH